MHPDDLVVGVQPQHLLDPRQVLGRIGVIAKIRVNREGHAAEPQYRHERSPARNGRQRDHRVKVPEQRLLHQVDLAHPAEDVRKLVIEQTHPDQHRIGLLQIGKRHGHGEMHRIRPAQDEVHGVHEIVLHRRTNQRADAVEVVRAVRIHRQHLPDSVHVGKPNAGVLEVLHHLVERESRTAKRAKVQVAVDDRRVRLAGAVVAGSALTLKRIECQRRCCGLRLAQHGRQRCATRETGQTGREQGGMQRFPVHRSSFPERAGGACPCDDAPTPSASKLALPGEKSA